MTLAGVTIAHVGHTDPAYARNRIITKALQRAGARVVTITDQRRFAARTPALLRQLASTHADLVLVGFPGHADVAAARLLLAVRGALARRRRTPIVFDPLVSLYETSVEDRRVVAPRSVQGWRYRAEDRAACALADVVLVDTAAHGRYFHERLGVPEAKLHRLWVGADDEVMVPHASSMHADFRVLFYGTFIPLHGLEHVVRAAHLLERSDSGVRFTIVGSGQTYTEVRSLANRLKVTSVDFLPRVPYEQLPELLGSHDVALGIFGTSGKAQRVIPNKVFDALATGRPVLTADTSAAREALTHLENAWLCAAGDADALAEAIVALKADSELRQALGDAGYRLYKEKFSLDAQAEALDVLIRSLVG